MPESFDIRHEASERRFVATVDGVPAMLDYRLEGQCMVITHTNVPGTIGGRGVAAALTQFAFEHARREGWQVRPACSYAAGWAERHPEFSQLLG
jgi:predicted GNAT family acetyltransferase